MNAYIKIIRDSSKLRLRVRLVKTIQKNPRKGMNKLGMNKPVCKFIYNNSPSTSSPGNDMLFAFPPSSPCNTTEFLIEGSEGRNLMVDQLADMVELGLTNAYGTMSGLMDRDTALACRMDRGIETLPVIAATH